MSFSSQATEQKVPFPYDVVFEKTQKAIEGAGMKVKSADPLMGRIIASVGMSLFSWGEDVTVVVEKINDEQSLVKIESSLKIGINVTGASKHQKNFNKIIAELSKLLQSG